MSNENKCFKCDQVINGEILNHDGREDTGQFIYICEACAEVGAGNIDLSRLPYGSIENVGRTWGGHGMRRQELMANYLHIDNALRELSCIMSPHNNEKDKNDWWECSTYIDVNNFNVMLCYEKCPPDEDGKCFVTDSCHLQFSMSEIIALLKAHNLYELENPTSKEVKDE